MELVARRRWRPGARRPLLTLRPAFKLEIGAVALEMGAIELGALGFDSTLLISSAQLGVVDRQRAAARQEGTRHTAGRQ